MTIKKPSRQLSFDLILTMSDMWLLPYIRHCITSLQQQNYPRNLYRILVSYYSKPGLEENISPLVKLCQDSNSVLSFSQWNDPVFSISKAYNIAARLACRDGVAFLDADIVFHPDMLRLANRVLGRGNALVVDVGRSNLKPPDVVSPYDALWLDETQNGLLFKQFGIGNIVVSRSIVNKIRGYDERFFGWGAADSDLYKRVKSLAKVQRSKNKIPLAVHLYHTPNPTKNTDYTKRNRQLWKDSKSIKRNPKQWGGDK